MSIIDITADQTGADQSVPEPTGKDRQVPGGLSQDTAGDDWDVSELDPVPEPGAPAQDQVVGEPDASTDAAGLASSDPEASPVTGTRPTFTITDAAAACAVSRKTITRKLNDLAEHGAAKDEDGVWRIPVEALLAVGLHPGRSVPATSRPAAGRAAAPAGARPGPVAAPQATVGATRPVVNPDVVNPDVVTIPRDRWDDLRLRLARAEAEAAERALALADARLALRALTAAPHPTPPGPALLTTGEAQRHAVPAVPPAVGWVMGAAPSPTASAQGGSAIDPGAAPPVAVVSDPPRKRRWWHSSAR